MTPAHPRALTLGLAALALGCQPVSGPVDVEALVPRRGDAGRFALGTVTLETVSDLYRGTGELFDIRGGLDLPVGSLADELMAQGLELDEMIERGRRQQGQDMAPRLALEGERYVAQDFDSLVYLTLFEALEEVWRFTRDEVGDDSAATSSRALIGFHGSISLYDLLPVPLLTSDNAVYVPYADAWLTLRPVLLDDSVPFAMNPGVIAHEFHHRVFFHRVFGAEGFDVWRQWVTSDEALTRSGNLVKALDEGLADIHAAGYVRGPAFMSPSLEGDLALTSAFRELDGAFADEASYDRLLAGDLGDAARRACGVAAEGEDLFASRSFDFYCLGTVLARALYEGADRDFDVLNAALLPAVNRALPRCGARIAEASRAAGALAFELDDFFEPLAAELSDPERRDRVCGALRERFASLVNPVRVPSCF